MGALTSKPYAFLARPWELEKVEVVDFFDGLGSSVIAEIRGFEIFRLLPFVNEMINEEWLSDKARFFFDSFRYQRLLQPFLKLSKKYQYIKINWYLIYRFFYCVRILFFKFQSKIRKAVYIDFVNDEDDDLYYLAFLKFNMSFFQTRTLYNLNYMHYIFDNSFLMFNDINDVFEYNCIVLVDIDLRLENPVLYSKLLNVVINNSIIVINFGAIVNDRFYNAGISNFDFFNFCLGKHFLSKIFMKFNKFLFLFGARFFFKNNLKFFKDKLITCFKYFNNYKVNFISIFGLNGLVKLNLSFLGLYGNFKNVFYKKIANNRILDSYLSTALFHSRKIYIFFLYKIFFFSNFNQAVISKNLFFYDLIFYIGHHGCLVNSINVNFIIPLSFIYERNNFYINMFKYIQRSRFVYSPSKNIRDGIHFFNFFFRAMFNIYYLVDDYFFFLSFGFNKRVSLLKFKYMLNFDCEDIFFRFFFF